MRCNCTPDQVKRYRQKISGPLLDRFDLQVPVNAVKAAQLQSTNLPRGKNSADIRNRVINARNIQLQRQGVCNAQLKGKVLEKVCPLNSRQQLLLGDAMEKLGLSARAYHRTLRVARSLADVDGVEIIQDNHVMEALSYRGLERRPQAVEVA